MYGTVSVQPKKARRKRRLAISLIILAGIAATAFVSKKEGPDRVAAIQSELAEIGDIELTVSATGKIQPRAHVDVGAQASGQLKRILVRIGDAVKQGDLLAEIDPQVQAAKVDADEAQLSQFNANLVEQEANVAFANAMLGRYSKLALGDSVSQMQLDQSARDAKTAAAKADAIRAQIKQMQSTLKADQVALGYTKIYAPMPGTIVSIDAREGQTLNAAYSTPQIMRIADLQTMTVWTQVSEADVARLKVGMPVYFTTLGHGDRRWSAQVRQILPAPQKPERPSGQGDANASTASPANNVVLYTVLFDIDNAEGDLRPEMTAQAFFVTASAKNVVVVPIAALHPTTSGASVKVEVIGDGGRVIDRQVSVGLRTRFQAEIASGLKVGERVVIGAKAAQTGTSLVGFHL